MASAAKIKDLQPIPDRISSTMRKILLERGSKRAWRNVRSNQIKNVCWLLERQDFFESKCGNHKFKKPAQNEAGGSKSMCVIIIISLLILQFSSFLIFLNYFVSRTI